MIPSWSIPVLGFGILSWFGWSFYKSYREAVPDKKKKLIKVYAILAIISIILFCSIKFSGLPQKIFPQYYQVESGGERPKIIDFDDLPKN